MLLNARGAERSDAAFFEHVQQRDRVVADELRKRLGDAERALSEALSVEALVVASVGVSWATGVLAVGAEVEAVSVGEVSAFVEWRPQPVRATAPAASAM